MWKLGGSGGAGGGAMSTGEPARLGPYVGAGVSLVTHDGLSSDEDSQVSGIKPGGKGYVGYRFHKYGAVEAAYHYFNEAQGSDTGEYESQGVSLALLGILPITSDGTGSVFLRAGGMFGWIDQNDTSKGEDSSGFSPIAGIGAEFDLSDQLSVRAEVEYVNNVGDGSPNDDTEGHVDVMAVTVGGLWRF